ncbi:hypothetical protein Tco_1507095 [Tanacetum coccineum]
MFEEYFKKTSSDTTINSTAQPTQVHEDSSSTYSIFVDAHEAPPVVTTFDEKTSPIFLTEDDEFNQEDFADFDDHPLDQVIGDPSKPVMTRQRLHIDSELWKNKRDPINIVVRNKTRLVAKGYKQEEGIDFEEFILLLLLALRLFGCLLLMLKKALYGLKQAPRAWYDKLSSFLIENEFSKIFQNALQTYMKNNFEMSMMGELKFFLGLQVHQSPRGIFQMLDADLQGTPTDQMTYRRMIGGIMYLTASRPDIAFATFVCARYQARPTVKHTSKDADHAGCKDDCKTLSGGFRFLRVPLLFHGNPGASKERFEYTSHALIVLMDATRKVDLEHVQCPPESKFSDEYHQESSITIQMQLLHPYHGFIWHKLTLTLDDFRTIFHLPQATDNNHNSFVPPPSFSDMVPFYKQVLGFTMELKTSSSFKTTVFAPMAKRYCKIFSIMLDNRVTGNGSTAVEIMQMMRSTHLTPPAPVPNVDKEDEMILQDTLQVNLADHKSAVRAGKHEKMWLVVG